MEIKNSFVDLNNYLWISTIAFMDIHNCIFGYPQLIYGYPYIYHIFVDIHIRIVDIHIRIVDIHVLNYWYLQLDLWVSHMQSWTPTIHLWRSTIHLWISTIIYGYPQLHLQISAIAFMEIYNWKLICRYPQMICGLWEISYASAQLEMWISTNNYRYPQFDLWISIYQIYLWIFTLDL